MQTVPITVRQLEALVRISEALAKMKLKPEVSRWPGDPIPPPVARRGRGIGSRQRILHLALAQLSPKKNH
jgi:hypothetical protein